VASVGSSRYRPDWLFGLSVVVKAQARAGRSCSLSLALRLHFHLPSALPCPRPFSVRVSQKFVLSCRYLYIARGSAHTARVPSALPSCHVADARRNLSPPADSTTPALPCPPPCHLQLAQELPLRPPLARLNRGNTAYHNPRGTTRPLAASTNPQERPSGREECALAPQKRCARVDTADRTPDHARTTRTAPA